MTNHTPRKSGPSDNKGQTASKITRRDLLKAAGAAALIPASLTANPEAAKLIVHGAAEGSMAIPPGAPLVNLTARETEILAAIVDRLIPSDELGIGALEADALGYIDRTLSEAASDSIEAYRTGLAALDKYSEYARGARFIELPEQDQDSVLIDLQDGGTTGAGVGFVESPSAFFEMVKSHTWQGTFGDPQYGGNRNFAGWDLIDYPGVRMSVTEDDQESLEADELEPARRSAYDHPMFQTGRPR